MTTVTVQYHGHAYRADLDPMTLNLSIHRDGAWVTDGRWNAFVGRIEDPVENATAAGWSDPWNPGATAAIYAALDAAIRDALREEPA